MYENMELLLNRVIELTLLLYLSKCKEMQINYDYLNLFLSNAI
jgi:hypothetical protein